MDTTLSLTGKNLYNRLNLSGKKFSNETTIVLEIKKIKIHILNNLIIPLMSKQWKVLNENILCLNKIKKKLDYYYDMYKLDELLIYKEMLLFFDYIICQNQQLVNLERKLYLNSNQGDENTNTNFSTMVYTTNTIIKLKPEYELYNLILGKPDKKLNQKYNGSIISSIQKMLTDDNITFNIIKETIIKKYGY
jgi:hypothetical protein